MTGWMEQTTLIAVIGSAIGYLAYRGWHLFRGKSTSCGSCRGGGCGDSSAKNRSTQLLAIDALPPRRVHNEA